MSRQISKNLARHYDSHLKKRPLATKMVTNFAICCTGDLICQGIVSKAASRDDNGEKLESGASKGLDLTRTARFGAVGACV